MTRCTRLLTGPHIVTVWSSGRSETSSTPQGLPPSSARCAAATRASSPPPPSAAAPAPFFAVSSARCTAWPAASTSIVRSAPEIMSDAEPGRWSSAAAPPPAAPASAPSFLISRVRIGGLSRSSRTLCSLSGPSASRATTFGAPSAAPPSPYRAAGASRMSDANGPTPAPASSGSSAWPRNSGSGLGRSSSHSVKQSTAFGLAPVTRNSSPKSGFCVLRTTRVTAVAIWSPSSPSGVYSCAAAAAAAAAASAASSSNAPNERRASDGRRPFAATSAAVSPPLYRCGDVRPTVAFLGGTERGGYRYSA